MGDVLGLGEDDPVTDIIYDKVYENFVEEIDAIDNGVNQYDGEPRSDIICAPCKASGSVIWKEGDHAP